MMLFNECSRNLRSYYFSHASGREMSLGIIMDTNFGMQLQMHWMPFSFRAIGWVLISNDFPTVRFLHIAVSAFLSMYLFQYLSTPCFYTLLELLRFLANFNVILHCVLSQYNITCYYNITILLVARLNKLLLSLIGVFLLIINS